MNSGFFQNMAPNAQRSFLITVALAALATVLYLFAVQPSNDSLRKARAALADLRDRESRMNADLKSADKVQKTLDDVRAGLKPYEDAMLAPLLESYAMRAKSILDPLVTGAGLTDADYADEPFRALPVPKPLPRQLHTRAAVRLTVRGSYQAIVSFLLRLEKELPFISVQALNVSAQTTPQTQLATIVLEWPAKGKVTRK